MGRSVLVRGSLPLASPGEEAAGLVEM